MNDETTKPATEIQAPNKRSRRGFLSYFLFGGITAWVGAALYTAGRFLSPPPTRESRLPKSVLVDKSIGDIRKNSGLVIAYGPRPVILIRNKAGRFHAFFATCPHLGCTVEYHQKSERIMCACHGGVFDLDGKNIEGPPPRPLEKLKVLREEDKIRVSIIEAQKA